MGDLCTFLPLLGLFLSQCRGTLVHSHQRSGSAVSSFPLFCFLGRSCLSGCFPYLPFFFRASPPSFLFSDSFPPYLFSGSFLSARGDRDKQKMRARKRETANSFLSAFTFTPGRAVYFLLVFFLLWFLSPLSFEWEFSRRVRSQKQAENESK